MNASTSGRSVLPGAIGQKPAEERRNHSEGRRNPSRGAAGAGVVSAARAVVSTSEVGFCRSHTETPSRQLGFFWRGKGGPAGPQQATAGNGGNGKPE